MEEKIPSDIAGPEIVLEVLKKNLAELEAFKQSTGSATKLLEGYRTIFYQMIYARLIDTFLQYISEILALCFRANPQSLSSIQVKAEFVLQFENRDELVEALAEKSVHDLSYEGLRKLAAQLEKMCGLHLFRDEDSLNDACIFVEVRNLITHNNGVINRIFLQRQPNFPTTLGHQVEVTPNHLLMASISLVSSAYDLDEHAASLFHLSRHDTKKPKLRGPLGYPQTDEVSA